MLVMLAGDQLLLPQQVCPGCLLADRAGRPRWQDGTLKCGNRPTSALSVSTGQAECPMGFRVVEVEN